MIERSPGPWHGRDDSAEQGDTRRLFQIAQAYPPHEDPEAPRTGVQDNPGALQEAVLLGFASDAGVRRNQGRPGARGGPQAIRRMLAGLPAHDLSRLWDAGDVACEGDALEQAQADLGRQVCRILDTGARLVVLGGGHEVAWGSFQGLHPHLRSHGARTGDKKNRAGTTDPHAKNQVLGASDTGSSLLIVNLDAHFDLRTSRPGNSGTPFDQILARCRETSQAVTYAVFGISRLGNTAALFEHAQQLGVRHVEDVDMQERHLDQRLAELDRLLAQADHVYLTIDLDCLPAAVAPGVSAPAAFGIPLSVVEAFARRIKASGKLRLAELAEMNPEHDIDGHTARVAARLAWTLLMP